MILALCLFLVLLAAPTLEQDAGDPSPCPSVFRYGPGREEPGRWYGVIQFSININLASLSLDIELDNEALLVGISIGNVYISHDYKNFRIEPTEIKIKAYTAVTLPFDVEYNPLSVTPRLKQIKLNGRAICDLSGTDIWTGPDSPVEKSIFVEFALRTLFSPKSTNPKGIDGKPQCGKVKANTTVLNGKSKLNTHWPWHIALELKQGTRHNYACGGALVTARHIITAAQCVTMESTEHAVDQSTLAVFLGTHKFRGSTNVVLIRFVWEIIVHPEYSASTYSHNVAILELNRPVKYTDWIKPACLWPENDIDQKNIIGKKGMLLSWRVDENYYLDDINHEEMPVVSQMMCIESHEKMVQDTSEYTYCAGNRRETSSCVSAGSGMVFKLGSTWHLRGLTSLTIPSVNGKRCSTTQYVIFTDLAKFLPWINSIVFDF